MDAPRGGRRRRRGPRAVAGPARRRSSRPAPRSRPSSSPSDVPDLVFTANAGLVDAATTRFVPSHFRHPERQPETDVFAEWFDRAGWDGHPPARRGGRTRAPATRSPSARCSVLAATGPAPTPAAAPLLTGLLGVPVRTRRAGRRAAVPPRPDVLPPRRPPRHVRAARLGPLRTPGRRVARARAAVAHRRRGARVLRQLGRGRRRHPHADRARRGSAASSRRGGSTSWCARSTSSSRPAAAAAASPSPSTWHSDGTDLVHPPFTDGTRMRNDGLGGSGHFV